MTAGVSVIVCCYNSVLRLEQTLTHLRSQKIKDIHFEIIIVDNASTDATSSFAQKFLAQSPSLDFTITYEAMAGLSYARKKGYSIAKFDFLLYCDDDNWLDENYVQLGYETMIGNPRIGILGGVGYAVFETQEPDWFKQHEIDFAVGEQSATSQPLSVVNSVYGAGFIIRKLYLDQLFNSGFQSILSDRKGDLVISGGDVELCIMAKYFNYEIWYSRNLKFKHFMAKSRLNWNYLKKLHDGFGRMNIYIQVYQYVEKFQKVPEDNLRFPFWLDVFIHKIRYVLSYYPKIMWKINRVDDKEVLRFIAMKAEAEEIWSLKNNYLLLFQSIFEYLRSIKKTSYLVSGMESFKKANNKE